MQKFRPILSILSTLFVVVLVILGIMKIWVPDMFPSDMFYKLILTFGVLAVASVVVVLLSAMNQTSEADGKSKGEKE